MLTIDGKLVAEGAKPVLWQRLGENREWLHQEWFHTIFGHLSPISVKTPRLSRFCDMAMKRPAL
jgi:hypothetical protein